MKATIRNLISQSCGENDHCQITQRAWAGSAKMSLNDTYRAIRKLQECGEIRIDKGVIYKTDKFQDQ